jgi:general stress protein 26
MSVSPDVKLHDLLEEFAVAMLITRAEDGNLRGRPMALAQVEPGGTLWFATGRHGGKVDELEHDSHVCVSMQSKFQFVSLSGLAKIVDDRDKIAKLWKMEWKVWFPGGKEDPDVVLLRVDGHAGEYWDNSGLSGIQYLIAAGKALVAGTKPDLGDERKIHAKVSL